ncbi:brain-specific angiogenesis inhibitor 1-associated protein 2-like isoform X2 [Anneissia japonica]|uniref:brain-specific angiogenesis inhibitor 1-associated protein 2-like isoform X2 n=1 Tax=Anneissia japonica TaxID=1529436 RepID=UPI00142551F7|nr:brain-specific angiogenesis inhibitor 1-associated protein 2-like isoform X2 [Anneissia japonica]
MTSSMSSDQIHKMTENVYRGLIEGLYPELRELLHFGKIYEKALQNVSASAKAYMDCLMKVGEVATQTKAARQIGQALLQLSETFKQIDSQREITLLAFRKELLTPIENHLEQETKSTITTNKTYIAENKTKSEIVERCRSEAKKYQKKSLKNSAGKYHEKEQKSSQELQTQQKMLFEFRIKSLKEAWGEERRHYCLIGDRCCSLVKNHLVYHSKAQSLFNHRLPSWLDTVAKPENLPEECDDFFASQPRPVLGEHLEGGGQFTRTLLMEHRQNLHNVQNKDRERLASTGGRDADSHSVGDDGSPKSTTGTSTFVYATLPKKTLVHSSSMRHSLNPVPPPSISSNQTLPKQQMNRQVSEPATQQSSAEEPRPTLVQAIYGHTAASPNQLSFVEGDIISLVGPRKESWHFGYNTRSKKSGWFPITFTHLVQVQNGTAERSRMSTMSADGIASLQVNIPSPDYGGFDTSKVPRASSTPQTSNTNFQNANLVGNGLLTTGSTYQHQNQVQALKQQKHVTAGSDRDSLDSGQSGHRDSPPHPKQGPFSPPDEVFEEQPPSNPFGHIVLRKTITNDRSAPAIVKDIYDTPTIVVNDSPRSNPFTGVQLRRTQTNDRSAPQIPSDYALPNSPR